MVGEERGGLVTCTTPLPIPTHVNNDKDVRLQCRRRMSLNGSCRKITRVCWRFRYNFPPATDATISISFSATIDIGVCVCACKCVHVCIPCVASFPLLDSHCPACSLLCHQSFSATDFRICSGSAPVLSTVLLLLLLLSWSPLPLHPPTYNTFYPGICTVPPVAPSRSLLGAFKTNYAFSRTLLQLSKLLGKEFRS